MTNIPPLDYIRRFFIFGSFRMTLYLGQGTLYILHQIARFAEHTLRSMTSDFNRFCLWVDHEMFGGITLIESGTEITEPTLAVTSITEAIADKHVMIIGNTGAGKSTVARYLAYQVGGRVTVYECEGYPGDWNGLEVIGRGEDWESISQGMQWDLDFLTTKVEARVHQGDSALQGTDRVMICEEFPEVKGNVKCAAEWLERHARRGRKLKQFLILLSQYDRVSAWGLDGKSDLADCFVKVRLGKIALAHAKRLKSAVLIEWLSQSKSHCLVDDLPCKLPSLDEMCNTSQRYLPVAHELQNHFLGSSSDTHGEKPAKLDTVILEGISEGLSDYAIARHKLGISGGSKYQKVKKQIELIREALDSADVD